MEYMKASNCKNCGAVARFNTCEYCGTELRSIQPKLVKSVVRPVIKPVKFDLPAWLLVVVFVVFIFASIKVTTFQRHFTESRERLIHQSEILEEHRERLIKEADENARTAQELEMKISILQTEVTKKRYGTRK